MADVLKKLKGRGPREVLTRAGQLLRAKAERVGLPGAVPTAPPGLWGSEASRNIFAPWAAEPESFVATLKDRWPNHAGDVVERAERILAGRFDLMGYKDLDLGRPLPDWHLDPVSGKRSSRRHWSQIDEVSAAETGDKKVIWELNRHQYLVTLGQAYLLTRDERYAEVFAAHLADWFEQNPPKIGVNWLSSLELAFRSMSWIRSWFLFDGSPQFTAELRRQMLRFLYLNARHIETYLSTYFSPNTHLTGEALGLCYLGTFLDGGAEAARWRETGHRILAHWLTTHVREDGSYCEQASHYARYTADIYSELLLLREREGLETEPAHKERLSALFDYLLHLSGPDGRTPLFGDDDGGRLYPFDTRPVDDMRGTLALGAALLGRGDLKYAAGEPGPELLWTTGPDGFRAYEAAAAEEPNDLSKSFADGCLFSVRSSWAGDADHILISCGPHGFLNGGHAHADVLGFTLYVHGRPIFIDSGTYVYTADPEARDRYRSTAAHNCLTVDGLSSSRPDGPFSWKTKANARLIEWKADGGAARFCGSHDGFERLGVRYNRAIRFGGDHLLEIVDSIESEAEHSFEVNFVLAPDITAALADGVVDLGAERDAEIELRLEAAATGTGVFDAGRWEIENISVSPAYGSEAASHRAAYKLRGRGSIEVVARVTHKPRSISG